MRNNHKIQKFTIKGLRGRRVVWWNIINAENKEIQELKKKFKFDESNLYAAKVTSKNYHAKVNAEKDYLFINLRFPYFDKKAITISNTEIDFFASKNYLVMLHADKIADLKKMFNTYQKENGENTHGIDTAIDLFYLIIETLLDHSFNLLDDISEKTSVVEDLIFSGESKKATAKLLNLRRSAVNIRTITMNYQYILEKFKKASVEVGIIDKRTPYPTVIEKTKDLLNTIENRQEMLEALYATNESISNYRLNDIMKTLTIFSVIVFPLTLLAAIFGMNTMNGMPFVNTPQGFWIIIIIMLVGSFGMMIFFKKKKWL